MVKVPLVLGLGVLWLVNFACNFYGLVNFGDSFEKLCVMLFSCHACIRLIVVSTE